MIAQRTILSRAAILLGTLVVLAALTGAAPPPSREVIGACEPDGTAVDGVMSTPSVFQWQRIERDLNEYARPHGYTVSLERTEDGRVSGQITPADARRDERACFFVPAGLDVAAGAGYARARTVALIRQMDALLVARWT